MAEPKDSCVTPAKGPIFSEPVDDKVLPGDEQKEHPERFLPGRARGGILMTAKVGKPAPDFEASAYFEGGFKNIRLSDYKGHWVVLCFYPGDFTFV